MSVNAHIFSPAILAAYPPRTAPENPRTPGEGEWALGYTSDQFAKLALRLRSALFSCDVTAGDTAAHLRLPLAQGNGSSNGGYALSRWVVDEEGTVGDLQAYFGDDCLKQEASKAAGSHLSGSFGCYAWADGVVATPANSTESLNFAAGELEEEAEFGITAFNPDNEGNPDTENPIMTYSSGEFTVAFDRSFGVPLRDPETGLYYPDIIVNVSFGNVVFITSRPAAFLAQVGTMDFFGREMPLYGEPVETGTTIDLTASVVPLSWWQWGGKWDSATGLWVPAA